MNSLDSVINVKILILGGVKEGARHLGTQGIYEDTSTVLKSGHREPRCAFPGAAARLPAVSSRCAPALAGGSSVLTKNGPFREPKALHPSKDGPRCVLRAWLATGPWKSWLHQVTDMAITCPRVIKREPLSARRELHPPAGQDPWSEGQVGSCVQTRPRVPADHSGSFRMFL